MAIQRRATSEPDRERGRIAVVREIDGRDIVVYYDSEEDLAASISDEDVADALSLAGVWSDVSWDNMEATLHANRHSTPPSFPIEP